MESQQSVQSQEPTRKRKLKFSEREQEVLIEEVVPHHDSLFGKQSLRVPEARKRRIWQSIQDKVNAVGVTSRTIEELRKRFYDMRQRSKERVAQRLKEAKQTGGGPSNSSDATPHEELLETTLQPESVVGVANIDSSEHTDPDPAQPDIREEDDGADEGAGSQEHTSQDHSGGTVTPTQPTPRRRIPVAPLPLLEAESHAAGDEEDDHVDSAAGGDDGEAAHMHAERAGTGNRRRPRPGTSAEIQDHITVFAGLEGSMLHVQKLQQKSLRSINRQLNTLNKKMDAMTGALLDIGRTLKSDLASRRRARQRHNQHLAVYSKAINRLCATTSLMARRSTAMQLDMAHCCQDMTRGLAEVTNAVEQLHTDLAGGADLVGAADTEDTTSRSSTTPPITTGRRRSERQGAAPQDTMDSSHQPERPRTGRPRRH